jgi:YidC/Oxa1 family membrane protein insertase
MTAPYLNSGIIKRAAAPVHHIYAFHSISSTHKKYLPAAFDNYDTVFCVGQYHIDEIRKTEEFFKLPPKNLILTGYPLVERLYNEHLQYQSKNISSISKRPFCLIAPSCWWVPYPSSIIDKQIDQIINVMSDTKYDVIIRPHPEHLKRFSKTIKKIEQAVAKTKNISLQRDLSSLSCLHEADVLITDHSGIAMEYALSTERPVLFIDTPMPPQNPNTTKIGLPVIEDLYRNRIGTSLSVDKIKEIPDQLDMLLSQQKQFSLTVPQIRAELIANWGLSAKIGGDFIISQCTSP